MTEMSFENTTGQSNTSLLQLLCTQATMHCVIISHLKKGDAATKASYTSAPK